MNYEKVRKKESKQRRKEVKKSRREREADTERMRRESEDDRKRWDRERKEDSKRWEKEREDDRKRWNKERADDRKRLDRERKEDSKHWEKEQREREKEYQKSRRSNIVTEGRVHGIFRSLIDKLTGRDDKQETSDPRFESDFNYDFNFEDFLKDTFGQFQTIFTPQTEAEPLSKAETTRQRLMQTLSADKIQHLRSCDEDNVRGFIATVYAAREVDTERTDWSIYIAYRRAIEVETPDPIMVEKTQIADILLDGSGRQAQLPF